MQKTEHISNAVSSVSWCKRVRDDTPWHLTDLVRARSLQATADVDSQASALSLLSDTGWTSVRGRNK